MNNALSSVLFTPQSSDSEVLLWNSVWVPLTGQQECAVSIGSDENPFQKKGNI